MTTTNVQLLEYSLADVRDIFNPTTFNPLGIMVFLVKSTLPHTSIMAFGNEYQFGRTGIIMAQKDPETKPKAITSIGKAVRTKDEFDEFLKRLNRRQLYLCNSYDLFNYNCLTFANIICNHLCRCDLPEKYLKIIERMRNLKVPRPVGKFLMGTSSKHKKDELSK